MNRLRLRTPSRLHFGLLSWGDRTPRQFGGIGLMIDRPGLEINAWTAEDWGAVGPLGERALLTAQRVASRLEAGGIAAVPPIQIAIHEAPPEHVGLGTGTQLSLAVARLIGELADRRDLPLDSLADLTGRGRRSGIGLHGFIHGGLIVDGGRRHERGIPPLLAHSTFPPDWSVLVLIPPTSSGLHGPTEVNAFRELPPPSDAMIDRLCRLVLLGILPAVAEVDLPGFGEALTELQRRVGQGFAPAQGGTFASPDLEAIAESLKAEGLHGIGQSSWGPTLYAFSDAPADRRKVVLDRLRARFGLDAESAFWTEASRRGAAWIAP